MTRTDAVSYTAGQHVTYRPFPGAPGEDGTVVEVRGDLALVLYRGDVTAKATRLADLTPAGPS